MWVVLFLPSSPPSSPPLAGLTNKLSLIHCLLSSVTGLRRLQADRPDLVPQHRVDRGTVMLNKRGRFRDDVELNRGLEVSTALPGDWSSVPSTRVRLSRLPVRLAQGDLLPWAYGHLHLRAQAHDEE